MVTMLILAIVAITIAQAVSMGKKIDMKYNPSSFEERKFGKLLKYWQRFAHGRTAAFFV